MRVIRSLKQIIESRGKPKAIRLDKGPEYISETLRAWTSAQGIELKYIQPASRRLHAIVCQPVGGPKHRNYMAMDLQQR